MKRLTNCSDGLCGALDCPRCNAGCDDIKTCARCGAEQYVCYMHECNGCCEVCLCENCADELCDTCKELKTIKPQNHHGDKKPKPEERGEL